MPQFGRLPRRNTPEVGSKRVDALVNKYLGHILMTGEQALNFNPVVTLDKPAVGSVLWRNGRSLEGYDVAAVVNTSRDDIFQPGFERMGFSRRAQSQGIWRLERVRYEFNDEQRHWDGGPSRRGTFAHYDAKAARWQVVRQKEVTQPGEDDWDWDDWIKAWQPMSDELYGEERAVVARIAEESELCVDIMRRLRGYEFAWSDFDGRLRQVGKEATPIESWAIGTIIDPYNVFSVPFASQFAGQFLVSGIYAAISDRAGVAWSSGGAERAMYMHIPPYEPVAYGLEK